MAKYPNIYEHRCTPAVHTVGYFDTQMIDKSLVVKGVLNGFEMTH